VIATTKPARHLHTRSLLAPSVAALFLWMIVPLAMTLWFSAERYNLLNPGKIAFARWGNYRDLLTHRALWVAMGNTLILVGLVLGITVGWARSSPFCSTRNFPATRFAACWLSLPFS